MAPGAEGQGVRRSRLFVRPDNAKGPHNGEHNRSLILTNSTSWGKSAPLTTKRLVSAGGSEVQGAMSKLKISNSHEEDVHSAAHPGVPRKRLTAAGVTTGRVRLVILLIVASIMLSGCLP